MSPRPTFSAFARSLALVPIALLLHIGAAAASDPAGGPQEANARRSAALMRPSGGAQEQARHLVLGITSPPSQTTQRGPRAARITGDAQEHARQVLLGSTIRTPRQPHFDVSRATAKRGQGDAQALAREVLLGRDYAPAAGR